MTASDRDHLRVLSICHYVLGGLCFLFGGVFVVYAAIGVAIVTEAAGPGAGPGAAPPEFMGWFFIGIAAVCMLFYWGLAAGLVIAGRCLTLRKWRPFCLVVAGFACLFQPLGLVLGIFTFIVLLRPSVRDGFAPERAEPPSEFDTYHSD